MVSQARLVEIFSSIQGESELIGHRQIFLRFLGCNLRCDYCDTPETLSSSQSLPLCRIERTPGCGDFEYRENPLSLGDVREAVARLNQVCHHSVALTGGEPLLQADSIIALLPALRDLGLRVYLETNGSLPDRLDWVLEGIDIIGMDVKLPSVAGESAENLLERHQEFLARARCKELFVKIVVGDATPDAELEAAVRMVAEVDPALPITLQPVTPRGPAVYPPSGSRLLEMQALAQRHADTVRVIPQTHHLMGLL
ncbi:MAG TPA: 7-carboxy-7-deazaguanine synthase QueE [Armatimonadota bacterium]|nr:7-carboxy-7-deazaguanine synthase QueE [Armatimonadota bacterium]HOM81133.1 7-carboxy-7-deazaguanine synthase QueE [Armatimonadota bacterium]HPO71709.1 7-carboxy-7-deazaguanine synthase QueE [Armatimonadota bacterium]HPT97687.1 7-carboxy-7-deazaguanine synthase QueE [Armatimonadota bacterium]